MTLPPMARWLCEAHNRVNARVGGGARVCGGGHRAAPRAAVHVAAREIAIFSARRFAFLCNPGRDLIGLRILSPPNPGAGRQARVRVRPRRAERPLARRPPVLRRGGRRALRRELARACVGGAVCGYRVMATVGEAQAKTARWSQRDGAAGRGHPVQRPKRLGDRRGGRDRALASTASAAMFHKQWVCGDF
jgi:hypothetical protein